MMWLYDNLATIVVGLIVLGAVTLIARKLFKDKKQGKSSCGCGCSGCAMNEQCHSKQIKK